ASATIKKVNDVVKLRSLINGKRVVVTEDVIRQALHLNNADGVECLPNEEIFIELLHCVSAKRTALNEFSCSMASVFICLATEEEEDVEVSAAPTPPSPTNTPLLPLQAQLASPSSPLQEQLTNTSESSMTLLNTLMETCATLRMHPNRGKIVEINVDEEITLVDVETQVDAELQGRIDDDNAATKEVNAAKPTVFDDEEVTMTMAQTLIKMKVEKPRLLDEQISKRLHDKEVKQAAAREKKYQSLKRKPVSIAQARKNMIIYLKNKAGYKMEHFKGMTYDKESFKKLKAVKVSSSESTQDTLTNDPKEMSEKDVQNMLEIIPVFEFKVKALQVKYPIIDWEIHSEGSRTYWKIIRSLVKEKFSTVVPTVDKEKALWVELTRLYEPNADDVFWKLQRYMHDPLTWKLYTNYGVHHVSSTRRHDILMLTEKDYPLLNAVMIMMLSAKLQVEEYSEMARDLVIKIIIEANKPKSRCLDTSSK
nr:hypothetical protein [Tanacetum cinerariifolium]